LAIGAQEDGDDLGVIEIAGGKERTERAIRHSRGKRFLLGRPSFAFEITARKLSDSGRFLAVIDGERKPILAFLDLSGRNGADEHHGVATGDDDCAVGEFGDFAGFDGYLRGPDLGRDLMLHNETTFWNLANPRPVTLIVGFKPEPRRD